MVAPLTAPASAQSVEDFYNGKSIRLSIDPEFLAEAGKLSLDIKALSGTTITSLLTELYAMPKNVIEKAAQAVSK
jgi:hypothetical protein